MEHFARILKILESASKMSLQKIEGIDEQDFIEYICKLRG